MKNSLNKKITRYLVLSISAVIAIQLLLFVAYHVYEYWGRHFDFLDEFLEFLILLLVYVIALPLLILCSTWAVKRNLAPLKRVAETAETIRAGGIGCRIEGVLPDDEVGLLAETLNETFDRYENLLDQAREFSSNASHQLKTPLAVIQTTAEVCLQQERDSEEYQRTLKAVLEETHHLNQVVEQLLLLSRLDAKETARSFGPFDLTKTLEELAQAFALKLDPAKIRFETEVEDGLALTGNETLIRTALANLLDNAFHAAGSNGQDSLVSLVARSIDGQRVEVCVRDSGPGIETGQQSKIFQRFHRVPGTSYGGSGLGLSIVDAIVKTHGGEVAYAPNDPGGSVFRIVL